jgi:hypothetical protein
MPAHSVRNVMGGGPRFGQAPPGRDSQHLPAESLEHQIPHQILAALPATGVGVLRAVAFDIDEAAISGDHSKVEFVAVYDRFQLYLQAGLGQALAPVQPARFVHRTALLDDHGRVREATLFALLDWKPQQAAEVIEHGAGLLVRAVPDGLVVLDPKGRVQVPDALRRFRGWAAGEGLLVSASPADGVLVLSSAYLLDSLVVLDACA